MKKERSEREGGRWREKWRQIGREGRGSGGKRGDYSGGGDRGEMRGWEVEIYTKGWGEEEKRMGRMGRGIETGERGQGDDREGESVDR